MRTELLAEIIHEKEAITSFFHIQNYRDGSEPRLELEVRA